MARLPALVATLLLASCLACSEDLFDAESDLVVLNESSCDLVIFVDGREAFTVREGSDRSLDDIGGGRHVLEALDTHGTLVERRAIELTGGEDYYLILENC